MFFFLAALLYCVCTETDLILKRLELIMGRNIPDNGTVPDPKMNDFIRREIMPHFEYGTFIDGEGQWKGELENTKIFYLECPDSDVEDHMLSLNCIAAAYKKQFRQESVLISQVQTNAILNEHELSLLDSNRPTQFKGDHIFIQIKSVGHAGILSRSRD